MKTSIIATLAVLATSAFALPEPGRGGWDHKDNKDYDRWGKGRGHKGDKWTSEYSVIATPDQVVNATEDGSFVYTGGLPGAKGYYNFKLNSKKNVICYDITLYGFRGEYESAADTATHIHEAPVGEAGPPRLAFKNPQKTGKKNIRKSSGCLQGPFMTGIEDDNGVDTGADFHVSKIEANPAGFFCDVHSSLAVPGAVRGQLG